ncbi:anthrone oxygenase family protein [Marivita sp.]|uniref:anthrone oxygenase family protein n=1 Tax=Marivita sp. TaxID=2003365 RepID=UPI003F6D2CF6
MTPLPTAYSRPEPTISDWSLLAARLSGLAALIFSGAIFGFFYAWICSTMWGLDATDPRVAIQAMQAMNTSVRNAVFAPAFFGTPFVLWLAALLAWRCDRSSVALAFATGGLVYAVGGMILTMSVNVPMNEALGNLIVPTDKDAAHAIWDAYSGKWQVYNVTRTVFSGITLALAGYGMMRL